MKNASSYRCPSDQSTRGLNRTPSNRSYSMSVWIGHTYLFASTMTRFSQIKDPPPSKALVFIDENEESIDDGSFGVFSSGWWAWFNWPGSWHSRGANLTFADGHSEFWRWRDSTVLKFMGYGYPTSPADRDLQRLQETVPKGINTL